MVNGNVYTIFIFMLITAITAEGQGQQKAIDWSVAFSLPKSDGSKALAIAGPIVGVNKQLLFIGGGANFPEKLPWQGGEKLYHRTIYVYRKSAGGEELVFSSELPFALAYGANCNTPKGVVAAGGENEQGLSNKVLLLSYSKKETSLKITDLPSLPFAVTNASLVYLDNKLYLAGGERQKDVSDKLLMLDMEQLDQGWIIQDKLPYPVSHTCFVAMDKALYLLGGRKRNDGKVSDFYQQVWEYLPMSKQWLAKKPLPEALSAGTALGMGGNTIWLFSGDNGATFKQVEALMAEISREQDADKKLVLIERKNALQVAHPGFGKKVWMYDGARDTWSRQADLPVDAPVTTTATLWGGQIYIPSGEVKAGIRSSLVLKGELK